RVAQRRTLVRVLGSRQAVDVVVELGLHVADQAAAAHARDDGVIEKLRQRGELAAPVVRGGLLEAAPGERRSLPRAVGELPGVAVVAALEVAAAARDRGGRRRDVAVVRVVEQLAPLDLARRQGIAEQRARLTGHRNALGADLEPL